MTLRIPAHPGKNVIRIRKVKGHFLPVGRYKITIRVLVGNLRGPAHTLKLKIER